MNEKFCPMYRTEFFKFFCSCFGQCDDFIHSFWNFLTFRGKLGTMYARRAFLVKTRWTKIENLTGKTSITSFLFCSCQNSLQIPKQKLKPLFSAHFQNRSIDHCDVGACLTSPIPLHGSTGPLCKHESAKWKCLYKNKVWNNKKVFRINAFFLFKFSKFQALIIYQVRGCDQVDAKVLTLRSLLGVLFY